MTAHRSGIGDDQGGQTPVTQQHADLADGWVLEIDLLDVLGRYVLAAGEDEDLRRATHELQVSVAVEPAEVAGAEPAVRERLGGRVGQGVVAGEDVRTAGEDLPPAP